VQSTALSRARRLRIEILLALGVLLIGGWSQVEASRTSSFSWDESRYISRARFFHYAFVEQDFSRASWADSESTHTQPMLTNFLVGGWLAVRGYDVRRLSVAPPYDHAKSPAENSQRAELVDAALLAAAREPMIPLGAALMAVLYILGRHLGGRLAGLVAVGLALGSPLLRDYLPQARSECVLALWIVLGLLLAYLSARQVPRAARPSSKWFGEVGLVLGLALSTKLASALSLAAILAWGLLVAAQAGWRTYRSGLRALIASVWRASRGWLLAVAVAMSVFVLSNPHLYPNPILHTRHLLEFRVQEAFDQQVRYPAFAMTDLVERAAFVVGQSMVGMTATGARGVPLEAGLFSIGAVVLARQTWRGWQQTGSPPAEGLVLLTILAYFVGVTAGLLMAWERYLVPTLLLGTLLSGVGASWVLRLLQGVWRPWRRRLFR
jgi:4-amino-4-deoxy-L-arabinose transferase-like glycosyltransferase